MSRETDQEFVKILSAVSEATTGIVVTAATTAGALVLGRWTRAQALQAAVAYHASQSDEPSEMSVITTARLYEEYIRNGEGAQS